MSEGSLMDMKPEAQQALGLGLTVEVTKNLFFRVTDLEHVSLKFSD